MPSVKTITPILGGRYYHIFNRGINRDDIFFQPKNYDYFFSLMKRFLIGYVEIHAYCLLPNHFHFVVQVKDELIFAKEQKNRSLFTLSRKSGSVLLLGIKRLVTLLQMKKKLENL